MDDLFEGLNIPVIPNEDSPSKKYTCRKCRKEGTVSWVEETQSFTCSNCGTVDGERTRKIKKDLEGVMYVGPMDCMILTSFFPREVERSFRKMGKLRFIIKRMMCWTSENIKRLL